VAAATLQGEGFVTAEVMSDFQGRPQDAVPTPHVHEAGQKTFALLNLRSCKAMNAPIEGINVVKRLEDWFCAQCDEDWEHSFGMSIETIDNPGWSVKIDLIDTPWADISIPFSRLERSDSDWIQIEVREGKFIGSGGVRNLNEILGKFHLIVGIQPQS
jgi:hypothetical protein